MMDEFERIERDVALSGLVDAIREAEMTAKEISLFTEMVDARSKLRAAVAEDETD